MEGAKLGIGKVRAKWNGLITEKKLMGSIGNQTRDSSRKGIEGN